MEAPQQGKAAGGSEANMVSAPLSPTYQATLLNARWNPTKEQLAMLEGLFENGVRTPSTEQIQHITTRLQEHGPIEAQNVFYWFHNHKAINRNSHNQEGFTCYANLLRRPPPLPVIARPTGPLSYPLARMPPPPVLMMAPPSASTTHNNGGAAGHVMYSNNAPYYYMPTPAPQASAANAGYYNLQQAHHKAVVYYPRMDITQDKQMNPAGMYHAVAPYYGNPRHVVHPANGGRGASADQHVGRRSRETLELFPLRPTFALPDNKSCGAAFPPPSVASSSFSGRESKSLAESSNSNAEALPFYDFLGLQSKGR